MATDSPRTTAAASTLDRDQVLRTIRDLFGIGLVALGAVVLTVITVSVAYAHTRDWLLRSREVLRVVRAAESLVIDRESALRAYLTSGDSATLAPERTARLRLDPLLDSLVAATADNQPQQARARAISQAVREWESGFAQPALAAAQETPATRASTLGADRPLFDELRKRFDEFDAAEHELLRQRDRQDALVQWGSFAIVGLEIVVLAMILFQLRTRTLQQANALFAQQAQLESQTRALEEQSDTLRDQAVELEHQMNELQTMAGELEGSNHDLTQALSDSAHAAALLRARDEEVRRAHDQLETIIAASPVAICLIDSAGVVRSWNPAAERTFGWTSSEVVGEPLRVLQSDASALRAAAARSGHITDVELQGRRKDGSTVHLSVSLGLLHDVAGAAMGCVLTLADISDRKRLEEQFLQAQKMEAVGRLAGGVAHDFNNMLTAIKSYSQLLLQELAGDDARRNDLLEIDHAADRAARLTRQLLAFSRQQMLQPRVLDLNQTIAELDKMLERLLLKDVTLVTDLDPALHTVRADPGQIEQVIMNLVVNARDAMPDGGQLTIRTRNVTLDAATAQSRWPFPVVPGAYVCITITDTGHGMNDATLKRIFEPFFTTKERYKGTGLGLSTVYGIVKQSGGYIWVTSAVDHGTTFEIYLPCAGDEAGTSRRPEPVAMARDGTPTVLLVEDDVGIRSVIRRILERAGYAVREASNGREALAACDTAAGEVDLVLSDIAMPEMQGQELARELKRLHPAIPVVLMSGYADAAGQQAEFLEANIAFLSKPFSPDALLAKIREVMRGSA